MPAKRSRSLAASTRRQGIRQAKKRAESRHCYVLVDVTDKLQLQSLARNRDLWIDERVQEFVKANFVFMQVGAKTTERASVRVVSVATQYLCDAPAHALATTGLRGHEIRLEWPPPPPGYETVALGRDLFANGPGRRNGLCGGHRPSHR